MKEKILSIFIFAFLLIIIGMTSVNAASSGIRVSAPSEVKVGDSVTVTVSFTTPIPGAQLSLNYNNSVVSYKGDSLGGTNLGSSIEVVHADPANMSTISSITFNFTAIAEGTANFSVSGAKLSDDLGEKISITSNSGAGTKVIPVPPPVVNPPVVNPPVDPEPENPTPVDPEPTTPDIPEPENPTFRNDNSTVYAKNNVNVRSSCLIDSRVNNILGMLKKGDEVTRTGISNGWERITYKGQTAYVRSGYLTTEKPEEDGDDNENNDPVDENIVDNNVVNEPIENNNVTENNSVVGVTENTNNNDGDKYKNRKYIAIAISVGAILVVGIIMFIIYKKVNDDDDDNDNNDGDDTKNTTTTRSRATTARSAVARNTSTTRSTSTKNTTSRNSKTTTTTGKKQ